MPKRKCGTCGQDIVVDRHNLDNIAFYQNRYHHVGCLADKANKGIASGKRVAIWEKLLNRIPELQEEAKKNLGHGLIRDEFNEYLLNHYDIISVPNRFWQIIEDIGNGNYRKNKCRPTDIDTIFGAWKYFQGNLDKIAARNKVNDKGPKNDEQRLNYDLAIIIQHIGDYKKHLLKEEIETSEQKAQQKETIKIDYKKVQRKNESSGLGDISDLIDSLI